MLKVSTQLVRKRSTAWHAQIMVSSGVWKDAQNNGSPHRGVEQSGLSREWADSLDWELIEKRGGWEVGGA